MNTVFAKSLRFPLVLSLCCRAAAAAAAAEAAGENAGPAETASPSPAAELATTESPAPLPGTEEGAAPDANAEPEFPPDTPTTAEEAIHLAREFLGGDERLDNIHSIRFRGSILMSDGSSGDVEIIARKPMHQHVTITLGGTTEITALDNYEGWRRVERPGPGGGWELTLLDADQVRRLRANVFENISFFKGIESVGGTVKFLGRTVVDGVPCVKVEFRHPRAVRFVRCFNAETGQLMLTETDSGTIVENGEIRVRGVRFPKELVNTTGSTSNTVIFSSITLNEEFPDSLFRMPMMTPGG